MLSFLLLAYLLQGNAEGPYTPANNAAQYPKNSLNNAGALFPLGGDIPSSRVHHTLSASTNYLFVYGGYGEDGSILGDINLFYIPSQQWSGPIVRKQCCNTDGEIIETIGADIPEGSNFDVNSDLPGILVGFEGDAPLPRSEHSACVVSEQLFIFGGVTEEYSYVNDVYRFDPILINWRIQDSTVGNSFPRRRAGHSMVCDSANKVFYIFGGRTNFGAHSDMGLNDLWRFDTVLKTWTCLSRNVGMNAPLTRQFASMIILNSNLYLFGGVDPTNGMTYNDIWVFHIALQQWELLYSPRTGNTNVDDFQYPQGDTTYQFAPPPLFLAHLLPIPESLDPATSINTTFYGSDDDITHVQNGGFLVYGGVGGGGNCGTYHCGAKETVLGQVYKFSLREGMWMSPHTITGAVEEQSTVNGLEQALQYTSSSVWQYARISSDPAVTGNQNPDSDNFTGTVGKDSWHDRGKWIKTFAYESAVFHPQRNVLYELGGMVARKLTSVPESTGSGSDPEELLTSYQQSTSITPEQVLAGDVTASSSIDSIGGETPIFLDTASGIINRDLWDNGVGHTGEHLRQVINLPGNGFWNYSDGFNAAYPVSGSKKPIEFIRVFRTYTVSPSDIVLVKEDVFIDTYVATEAEL